MLLGLLPIEKKTYKDRLQQFKMGSEGREPGLQQKWGNLFYSGRAIPPNYKQAVDWFKKAAQHDFAPALMSLGECFEYGLGINQDVTRAVDLYLRAAAAGNEKARYRAIVLLLEHRRPGVWREKVQELVPHTKWKTYKMGELLTEYIRNDVAGALMAEVGEEG